MSSPSLSLYVLSDNEQAIENLSQHFTGRKDQLVPVGYITVFTITAPLTDDQYQALRVNARQGQPRQLCSYYLEERWGVYKKMAPVHIKKKLIHNFYDVRGRRRNQIEMEHG